PVRMVREPTRLPDRGRPTIAGVSSFGMSGTNAHLVLAAAPAERVAPVPDRTELPTISAATPEALAELAGSYADLLCGTPPPWQDIASTAATRRRHMENRLALVASSAAEAAEALRAYRDAAPAPELYAGTGLSISSGWLSGGTWVDPTAPPRVAFLF